MTRRILVLASAFLQLCLLASAQDHWVATWAASPQQFISFPRAPRPAGQSATAPQMPAPVAGFKDQTIRMIVHTSIGGRRARIQLSNAHGTAPLLIGSAHIAIRSKDSAIVEGSDRTLQFNGKPTVKIPTGASVVSDPVDLTVPQLADLAISVYVPGDSGQLTMHLVGLHTTYISKEGDTTGQPALADATTSQSWYWLSEVDVLAPADAAAVVAFGDSITDGATSTPNADRSWPSILAQRLISTRDGAKLAVVNHGISGNRLLNDGAGISALARFDRDVLAQAGVKWLMVLEGINDIGIGSRAGAAAGDAVTADDLIGALRQMIERAHTHSIKVVGCTLTPYGGASYSTEKGEEIRDAVNRWIRTGGAFDAVVDFDAVTRDPENPKQIRADYHSGDHLHPNDAGLKAMADAVDLSIFARTP